MDIRSARSQNLCDFCNELDFERIFTSMAIPETGIEIRDIGKRPTELDRISCDSCRFFHQLGPDYQRRHSLHVRLFDHLKMPSTNAPIYARHRFLSVLRKNSRLTYDHGIKVEIKQAGVIGYIPRHGYHHCEIRGVTVGVDYEFICNQLRDCAQHIPCKQNSAPTKSLPYIYFIDCEKEEIVKGRPQDRYMTLSYVWGIQQPDVKKEPFPAFSITDAPLTVRDAITVVRKLGRRFLWVDRYCIDQATSSEKDLMIGNMDVIYESSEATIVALHGNDDMSGLPGVSSVLRIPQPFLETTHGRLISSMPPIATLLANSTWNNRGWTYQEARLSRRCIFFTEYQSYFVCRVSTWSEAVISSSGFMSKLLDSQRLSGALFGEDGIGAIPEGIFRDRFQYSKRSLTYEHDRLQAFRGILHRSSFITYWGIPVKLEGSLIDRNVIFVLGFLWRKRPNWSLPRHVRTTAVIVSTRRHGFPTWSWTSLNAEIYQDPYGVQSLYGQYLLGNLVDFPPNEAGIQFSVYYDGNTTPLQELRHLEDYVAFSEVALEQRLLVDGDFIPIRHKYRKSHGVTYEWCQLFGKWRYFDPDVWSEKREVPKGPFEETTEADGDALILVLWNDSQKPNMRRFVLMLIDWIDDEHAERRGLLTGYKDEFRADAIAQLPRIRKKFILQ